MSVLAERPVLRVTLAVVLLISLIVGAQALASASAPQGGVAATGRVLGRTGFAFVGGLRTFVAAMLWNRLDPQFDTYYGGSFDKAFAVFLPTIRIVEALDPQFEEPYYVASFWLQRNGHPSDALALAEQGLRNNPRSGRMHANLAQVLLLQDKKANLPRMLELADQAMGPGITWSSPDNEFEALGIFTAVYSLAGDTEKVAKLKKAQDQLKSQGAAIGVER